MKIKEHINKHVEEMDDTENSETTLDLIDEKGGNPMPPRKFADIGSQLQDLRLKAGLIQADVAAALGLKPNSFSAISRWETGRLKVPRKHHTKLRELYGLPQPNEHSEKTPSEKIDLFTSLTELDTEFPYTGDELQNFRKKTGLTRADVAVQLGLQPSSKTSIGAWETGRLKVPRKHYTKLRELYRLPPPNEHKKKMTDNKTDKSTLVLTEQNAECPYTGFQLKTFREKAGLTQVDVALELGFPSARQSTISKWEADRLKVPRKHYAKLRELYRLPISDALNSLYNLHAKLRELYRLPPSKKETDAVTPMLDKPEKGAEDLIQAPGFRYTGAQLKTFREKAGLTQVDVALELGFKPRSRFLIANWETGHQKVPYKHFQKLRELYRLPQTKEETNEVTPTIDKPEGNEER